MSALTVEHVTKTFRTQNGGSLVAVRDLSLAIQPGQIYGLLGPNGAGKSTLINIVSGVLRPDGNQGRLEIFGTDVLRQTQQAKQLLGVVPQEIVIEPAFTVEEVLFYFGGMYGLKPSQLRQRISEVLADLELLDKQKERARYLSGGMKRRLMIAKAVLHKPRLLILDEPTAGVDVALRQRIWNLVRRLHAEGTTIIFTTHYLEEAEQLCDSMTVINHGRIVKQGRVKQIQQEFSTNVITFELFEPAADHLPGVRQVGSEFEYPLEDLARDMNLILGHYGSNLKSIRNEAASLEKVFLELTSQ